MRKKHQRSLFPCLFSFIFTWAMMETGTPYTAFLVPALSLVYLSLVLTALAGNGTAQLLLLAGII
jgi:hypothetical protein